MDRSFIEIPLNFDEFTLARKKKNAMLKTVTIIINIQWVPEVAMKTSEVIRLRSTTQNVQIYSNYTKFLSYN